MGQVPQIEVSQARAQFERHDALFVDLRDAEAYQAGHIPGAVRLDASNFEQFLQQTDKGRAIIVYCYHGISSLSGVTYLRRHGFRNVCSLSGGFDAWRHAYGLLPVATAAALDHKPIAARWVAAIEILNLQGDASLGPGKLAELYHPRVYFEDPVQRLQGRDAFIRMRQRAIRRARRYLLKVDEIVENDSSLFANWTLHYRSRIGPPLRIEGVSHLRIEQGQIVRHVDHWDLVGNSVAWLPGLSVVYRRLARLFR